MSAVNVKNKRIFLVGATGVLGRTYSKALSDEGANLVLADLPSSDVLDLAQELGCKGIHIDLAEEQSVIAACEQAYNYLDGFDGVVNNAAITGEALIRMGEAFAPFEEYPTELYRKTLDVNLTGPFLVAREAGKRMKADGKGGSFINVSSIYGRHGPDHRIYDDQPFSSFAGYSASKSGVIGLTKWLATYWAKDNIRVNCLAPGGVFNGHNEKFVEDYTNRIPLGRMAKPEDMIGILIYLLSDSSSYCTGSIYDVDGGLAAW